MKTSGIYIITNTITRQVYIGQSKGMEVRLRGHQRKLKRGGHDNCHLQRSVIKHGIEAFKFEVLQKVPNHAHLYHYEWSFWDYYRKLPSGVFNIEEPSEVRIMAQETKDKLSAAKKGQSTGKQSRETIEKRKVSNAGFRHTEATKLKMSISQTGRKLSASTRAKLSASKRGKPSWNKGRKHTPEHCINSGNAKKNPSKETRAKMSAAAKRTKNATGHKHSPETKLRMSIVKLGKKNTPEQRLRKSEAQKLRWQRRKAGVSQ